MIVGLSGFAGVGKDTVADILTKERGYVKVSLADPLKKICRDVFDFTDAQLWGPSEMRNAPDSRYPRAHKWSLLLVEDPEGREQVCVCCGARPVREGMDVPYYDRVPCYLTPRYALQTLGTEWGRNCYPDVWTDYAIRTAKKLLSPGYRYLYSARQGLHDDDGGGDRMQVYGVVIPDVRFVGEFVKLKEAGAKLVRVKRTGYEAPRWDHPSETEQTQIADEAFDHIIENRSTLDFLKTVTDAAVRYLERIQ